MAGRGAIPKENTLGHSKPTRPFVHADSQGWQYGDTPNPPPELLPASIEAWDTWFGSWFAAFWSPADVPALRQLVRLYDQVERGEFQRHPEMRLMLDTYGISPKGQDDRRWKPPVNETPKQKATTRKGYNHLHAVGE